MVIFTKTIVDILEDLSEKTGRNLDEEIEEIYNFLLILEEEKEKDFELKNIEQLKPNSYKIKIQGKQQNIKKISYSKKRKVFVLSFLNGKQKTAKKIKVELDIKGISLVSLLQQFNQL